MKNINLESYFSETLSNNINQAITDVTDLLETSVQQLKAQYQVQDHYGIGKSAEVRRFEQEELIRQHLILLHSILNQLMIDDWYIAEPWPIEDHRSEILNLDQVTEIIYKRLRTKEYKYIPINNIILQVIDQNATDILNQYQTTHFGATYTFEVLLEQVKKDIRKSNISLHYTSKSIKFIQPDDYSYFPKYSLVPTVKLILLVVQVSQKVDCQQDLKILENAWKLDELACNNVWLKSIKFYQNKNVLLTCRNEAAKDKLLFLLNELDSFKYVA